MPYSITTKDGITINNIPDDVKSDSQQLRDRVAQIRQGSKGQDSQPAAEPVENPSYIEKSIQGLTGLGEGLLTIGTGAAGSIEAGLRGIFGGNVEEIIKDRTYVPRTKEGLTVLEGVGSAVESATDAANYIGSGLVGAGNLLAGEGVEASEQSIQESQDQGVFNRLGGSALDASGSPLLATAVNVAPDFVGALSGAGALKSALKNKTGVLSQDIIETLKAQSPKKQEIAKLIQKETGDTVTANFKIEAPKGKTVKQAALDGTARVVKDKEAIAAIKQGFDEGVIASIKRPNPLDRRAMQKMVDIAEKATKNKLFGVKNRPLDIVGGTIGKRVKILSDANKKAGSDLNQIAKSLKGQKVDVSTVADKFIDDLAEMGITLNEKMQPQFKGSLVEGASRDAKNAQGTIKILLDRMLNTKIPDAFDMHRFKKFIDGQVNFGKTQAGLAGGAEKIAKSLRKNVDELLDNQFPEYNNVNTIFSETRGALDLLQDIAGKKSNLTGANANKEIGQLLRGLMSNNKSRVRLLEAVEGISDTAKKYGGEFKDDILKQLLFADELDNRFGAAARTSFKGQISQAIPTSKSDALAKGVGAVVEKLRGINDEAAFKSIKELLRENAN